MRGHYAESPEVKADRELRACARRYAGEYLRDMFSRSEDEAVEKLKAAAIALRPRHEQRRGGPGNRATPRCASASIRWWSRRERHRDGHRFFGCSQYPKCTFTLPSYGAPEEHENGCPFDVFFEDGDPAGDTC